MSMSMKQSSIQPSRHNRGFSILELMIALLLGVVVVAGIVQLFVGNSRTYDLVNAQSRLQENARYGFEFLSGVPRRWCSTWSSTSCFSLNAACLVEASIRVCSIGTMI